MPSEGELRFWTNVLPSELTIHCFPWVPVPSVNGPNGATLKQSKSSIEHWTIGNFPNLLHFVCFANLYFSFFLLFLATTVFFYSYLPVIFSCTLFTLFSQIKSKLLFFTFVHFLLNSKLCFVSSQQLLLFDVSGAIWLLRHFYFFLYIML